MIHILARMRRYMSTRSYRNNVAQPCVNCGTDLRLNRRGRLECWRCGMIDVPNWVKARFQGFPKS